jgi:DNA polymerase-3 subunit alpha
MCAMLNAEKGGKIEKLMIYLKECKILKIDVLPPHINSSFSDFEIEGKKGIRFGLSAVKNIGETNIRFIIDERNKMGNFTSLSDLLNRVEINKKVMENLVLSGALDGLIPNRASVIHNMERILQFSTLKKKERNSGMGGLFESSAQNTSQEEIHLDIIGEYKENELLKMEKINLGLYVTGHPLAKYADKIVAYSTKTSSALKEIKTMIDNDDQAGLEIPDIVQLAGMIIGIEYKKTKNNDDMAILTLEDLESELKVVIFPKTFKKVVDKLVLDEPILIKGKAIFDQKEAQINAEEIQLLKPLPEKVKTSIINIKLDEKCINEENINFLKKIFSASRGLHPIIFHMYDLDLNRKVNIRVGQEYYIAISDAVQERIKQVSCVEGLWVSESN